MYIMGKGRISNVLTVANWVRVMPFVEQYNFNKLSLKIDISQSQLKLVLDVIHKQGWVEKHKINGANKYVLTDEGLSVAITCAELLLKVRGLKTVNYNVKAVKNREKLVEVYNELKERESRYENGTV